MKILMLLNEDSLQPNGGLGVHVRELSNQLRKSEDIDLCVVGVNHYNQEGGFFLVGDEIKEVCRKEWKSTKDSYRLLKLFNTNDHCTRMGFITKMITEDIFMENVLSILGKEEFDLIHMHDCHLWRVAKNLQALYKCPIMVSCHLSFYASHLRVPDHAPYIYEIQTEGTALHKCSKIIAVSEIYKKLLMTEYFLDEDKIEVIYNAVDYDFLSKVEYDAELRAEYGNKPLVVYVGRMVPSKGVDIMLEIIPKLPNYNFVFVSSMSLTVEDIQPIVKKVRFMNENLLNFQWFNFLSDEKKWELMKVADIGLMPSIHEPFGIVALEWMSLGTPFIVSNRGGLKEFCNAGNSTVINPTAENLLKAIQNHIRDEAKIQNGIETAKQFKWEDIAKKTIDVYSEVVS